MQTDPRIQHHINTALAVDDLRAMEWEEQNWTEVSVQLTPQIHRTFAVKKEDVSQILYLLEVLSS